MKNSVRIDMVKTGENIARLRRENNLTIREVQNAFGFSTPQAIFKWQRGENMPNLDNLVFLADLFGVSVGDILVIRKEEAEEEEEIAIKIP